MMFLYLWCYRCVDYFIFVLFFHFISFYYTLILWVIKFEVMLGQVTRIKIQIKP